MQHKKLQLMVHGRHIAGLDPAISYPGVRIDAVTRVANRNYLFIDLTIGDDAAPGKFDIVFGKAQGQREIGLPAAGARNRVGAAHRL
jgi:hypothetical protein